MKFPLFSTKTQDTDVKAARSDMDARDTLKYIVKPFTSIGKAFKGKWAMS